MQFRLCRKFIFSFDLKKQKSFNGGQMYVALSTVASIDKLFLIGKYNPNAFEVNKNATIEFGKLCKCYII